MDDNTTGDVVATDSNTNKGEVVDLEIVRNPTLEDVLYEISTIGKWTFVCETDDRSRRFFHFLKIDFPKESVLKELRKYYENDTWAVSFEKGPAPSATDEHPALFKIVFEIKKGMEKSLE